MRPGEQYSRTASTCEEDQSIKELLTFQPPETTMATASAHGSRNQQFTGKHPVYRGIRCRSGKWVSEIREPRKTTRIWLGTYPTPEMAAAAYDVAARALKGADVALNFPDSVHTYPVPASASPPDIRAAAASAAASRLSRPEACDVPIASQPETEDDESSSRTHAGEEFVDEEVLFDMPKLLVSMAEGLLISPPRINSPPSDYSPGSSDGESLWSYS